MLARARFPARFPPVLLGVIIAVLALTAWYHPGRSAAGPVSFTRGTLDADIQQPTSLAFGPDGRLYVASETRIEALTLNAEGTQVTGTEVLATGLYHALGIAFDPTAPASPLTVYFSRQDSTATDGFHGTISRITAPGWTIEDVITGLPTSEPYLNHMTNGIAFDSAGQLFIAQGSSSNTGLAAPGGVQTYWPETPLSAAILVADIHAPGFTGTITYDPAGPPADDNVDKTGGDVDVFAAGLRNPYDLVLHSNGRIYAADNGPMGGSVMGLTSLDCDQDGGSVNQSDELNLIAQGNYYGFPNRNRGRADPRQCVYQPPSQPSTADFTAPIAVLPAHCSCDGIAEYTSDAFGGAMQGDLIFAQFQTTPRAIWRGVLSDDGADVTLSTLASGFSMPLDVTVSPTGIIYIAEYSGNSIAYLEPPSVTPAPTATAGTSVTPTATPTPPDTTPGPTPSATLTPTSSSSPTPTRTPEPLIGDGNCDGVVNAIDATLVLQLSAGLIATLSCAGGDVNGDGLVNAIDAQLILQYVAGLIPALPLP